MTKAEQATEAPSVHPIVAEAERCGVTPRDLEQVLRSAGWTGERFRAEIASGPGWATRWVPDAVAEIARRESRVCPGPETFKGAPVDVLKGKLHAKLSKCLAGYTQLNAGLFGPTGCGKSVCAWFMLRSCLEAATIRSGERVNSVAALVAWHYGQQLSFVGVARRPSVAWVAASDLFTCTARHPLGKGEPELLTDAKRADYLVIDDITWSEKDHVFLEVMSARYNMGKTTIVTCGATKEEVLARFGDAMARRIIECEGVKGVFVDCFG